MTYLDPCPLGKWISTVSCLRRKSTCPRQLDRNFFKPCITISCFITCCCGPQNQWKASVRAFHLPSSWSACGEHEEFPSGIHSTISCLNDVFLLGGGGGKSDTAVLTLTFRLLPFTLLSLFLPFFCLLLGIEKASFRWKTFLGRLLGS